MQCECSHPLPHTVADILEGDCLKSGIRVEWCRLCGSVKPERDRFLNGDWRGDWQEPRAAWWQLATTNSQNIADIDFLDWPPEAQSRFMKWLMSDELADRC